VLSNNKNYKVTVLMPCLNESETLEVCIQKAKNYLKKSGVSGEVIIADNGSTDGSQNIANLLGARLVNISDKGYGSALKGGITNSYGQYIIMGDADDSYDFSDLEAFIQKLEEGYDLVMGNRFKGGIKPGAMPFLHRYLGNPILSWLGKLFFKSPASDFHCGMRAFRKDAILRLNLQTTGMEFASEMLVKATLSNLKITEVPIILYPDGRSRKPHLRTWRDGWRHLRFLLLYSPRWLFLYPGIALTLLSWCAIILLLPTSRIHSLLYAALLSSVGFQIVFFAIFTKIFAISEGLLPPDKKLDKFLKKFSVDLGLQIGLVLFTGGLIGSFTSLSLWQTIGFGELDPVQMMKITIPSASALVLGIQAMASSFFIGILQLKKLR
jgi:glycosyltransferase involved in cell wall biosynthesis